MSILLGDCLDVLKTLDAESIDACVTDPPYGIGFMGKEWDSFGGEREYEARSDDGYGDKGILPGYGRGGKSEDRERFRRKSNLSYQTWSEQWAREVFRVLKPGAHIVVCGAPRAYHRMASGLEDAGFEIRDCLAWLFGSGFPKSLNLGEGVGTALKPAHEPIVLARKPFKGTVKGNVEKFGTGALNIDACRLDTTPRETGNREGEESADRSYAECGSTNFAMRPGPRGGDEMGRWPANVVIDDLAALVIDEQSGELTSGSYSGERSADKFRGVYNDFEGTKAENGHDGSVGGASRFYYCAKPSREERDMGCYGLPVKTAGELTGRVEGSAGQKHGRSGTDAAARNFHPTVKPIELMRWLIRLVTPINGCVLDPFLGSGTTGMAAKYEQRSFIGIEREAEYLAIAERRIAAVSPLFATPREIQPPASPTESQGDMFNGEDR